MTENTINADICVIGAGSGGLSVAAGAAMLGAKTVLIEKSLMGGDCLNYGCVPSKALIAAARRAHQMTDSTGFGIGAVTPEIDFGQVHGHVHNVIDAIAPTDSQSRFEALGVRVIRAAATFSGRDQVTAGDSIVKARRFVIATGSSPAIPPIDGLADTPFLTNETLFDLKTCPDHLLVIGGGPIAFEMAQAFRRLGAGVTVLVRSRALPREDPEMAAHVVHALRREGVDIREGVDFRRVSNQPGHAGGISVAIKHCGCNSEVIGSHLLVATGRTASIDGLGLAAAGVNYDKKGVTVDKGLRTSSRKIYAIGDVAGGATGGLQFTHMAGYQAGLVIRNALFRMPVRVKPEIIPRVTYTDPELAAVGLDEATARERHGVIRILRWPFAENDRAEAERSTDGMVKVIVGKRGKILGASIVGEQAGDLLQPWTLAVAQGLKIGAMAGVVAPYPTRGEASKRAASSYFTPGLFSAKVRRIVRFLARFG